MQCNQCSRPAICSIQGHPLCVEHAAMFAQVQNAQNDNMRLKMAVINDLENSMDASIGLAPRRPMQIPPRNLIHAPRTTVNDHSIRIDRSTIGVLNTGTIGTLNASVSLLEKSNPQDALQIKSLIEAISRNQELEQQARKGAIEQISYLLSQVSIPAVQRNNSVLKTILAAIGTTLSTSADLYTLWQAGQQVLIKYLST